MFAVQVKFPYALWRDVVSNRRDLVRPSLTGACFHTPCGVTLFRTSIPRGAHDCQSFPYALWRDVVSNKSGPGRSCRAGMFPYALWRDVVSNMKLANPSLEGGAVFPYALWRDVVSNVSSRLREP